MEDFQELFYREPYTRTFEAEALRCLPFQDHFLVVLSDTAFYPEGGGQPGDTGTLNGIAVVDTRHMQGEIVHETLKPIAPGTRVHGEIDWNRRLDHMQQHTGEHMFSGLVHAVYGYENVGFHMGADQTQVDFDGVLTWAQAMAVEQKVNAAIWQDLPLETLYPDEEERRTMSYRTKKDLQGIVRMIVIPGVDTCACCGTHVRRTGEVGLAKVVSLENYKKGVRLHLVFGMRAYQYVSRLQEEALQISRQLSVPPLQTAAGVSKTVQELEAVRQKVRSYQAQDLEAEYGRLKEGAAFVLICRQETDAAALRRVLDRAVKEKGIDTAAGLVKEENGWRYTIISRRVNLKETIRSLNAALNGRGGGSSDMVQGRFSAPYETIEAVLRKTFEIGL
jgi:alanyl-tRNA synthetase